ncbi:MAG TPA: tetratricopeptide repeat protein [Candidatus Angelobacter sp.]|nr:tetratricopeptide repeat protein [Candidatus Angelobacter sp.]
MPSSLFSRVWIWLAVAVMTAGAAAQRGSNTGSSTSRSNIPSRTPNTPDPSLQPTFISGKVLLEGGGTLPEPVAIERICNGVSRREGYTDFKGQFEFQVGVNMTFQDASESDSRTAPNSQSRATSGLARRGGMDLNGCEIKALLPGYQSTVVVLHTTGDNWQYEVGTLLLKRMGDAKGSTISVTSMAAPKEAMRAYEKAQRMKQEKPAEAEKELNKAVQIFPQFAAAWTLLGDLHRQHERFDEARTEYARAISADPQYVNPAYGLAAIAMREKKWDEAVQRTEQVVKMNAFAFPLAYLFNAAANYNQQKFDAAEESARKFKTLDTEHSHPDVCLLLSYIYSRRQDYAAAAREIREYLAVMPEAPDAESLKSDAKRLEDLSVQAQKQ